MVAVPARKEKSVKDSWGWREPSPRVVFWALLGMTLLALLAHVLWMRRFGFVIENEGAGYARLAENLLSGRGYIGILGDRHTLMPPLFAFLIALVTPLAGDAESAARMISCVAGALLVWPVYGIVASFLGAAGGLIAAVLIVTHGVMLGFSGSTYVEGVYFFVLFSGLALTLRAMDRPTMGRHCLTGLVFGLAYLIRPEAIAYVLLAAVFLLIKWLRSDVERMPAIKRVAALLFIFVLVIAPYVAWLSVNSGYFRLNGKSLPNAIVNDGMSRGMDYAEASRRLGDNLQPIGPDLYSDQFLIARGDVSEFGGALQTVFRDFPARPIRALRIWAEDPDSGGPLMVVLGVLGLVAGSMMGRSKQAVVMFFFATGGYILLILSVEFFFWYRYVYPFTFFALIWAAAGVWLLSMWVARMIGRFPVTERLIHWSRVGTAAALLGMVSVSSLGARYAEPFDQSSAGWAHGLKEAGHWIGDRIGAGGNVMGISAVVPYYAQADMAMLPWAPADQALAYIHLRNPDFIVLRTAEAAAAPYIRSWIDAGIPDACATEQKRITEAPMRYLVIYRWSCGDRKS